MASYCTSSLPFAIASSAFVFSNVSDNRSKIPPAVGIVGVPGLGNEIIATMKYSEE